VARNVPLGLTMPVGSKPKLIQDIIGSLPIILQEEPRSGIYLFYSYDLVNSTFYKAIHPGEWPLVFQKFYELVQKEADRYECQIWKFVGDEVLLYKYINYKEDLYAAPQQAFSTLNSVRDSIHNLYENTKTVIDIKGSLWMASATYIAPEELKEGSRGPLVSGGNLVFNVNRFGNSDEIDFLGSDVDIGFRLAKYSARSRLVVSANLAYLLYMERQYIEDEFSEKIESNLKIVSYESLKGIWGDRKYPIIWYDTKWSALNEMFLYDEEYISPIIKAIKDRALTEQGQKIAQIKKVFNDLNKTDEIEQIQELIKALENKRPKDSVRRVLVPPGNFAEVHCVAVCFEKDGKLLIGKRPLTKSVHPGKWEFGCAQLKSNQSFEDAMKDAYKEDFSADIDFGPSLIPFSVYKITKGEEQIIIPGIIFAANLLNDPKKVKKNFSREKHTDIQFVNLKTLCTFPSNDCVPDFQATAKKAFDVWKTFLKSQN